MRVLLQELLLREGRARRRFGQRSHSRIKSRHTLVRLKYLPRTGSMRNTQSGGSTDNPRLERACFSSDALARDWACQETCDSSQPGWRSTMKPYTSRTGDSGLTNAISVIPPGLFDKHSYLRRIRPRSVPMCWRRRAGSSLGSLPAKPLLGKMQKRAPAPTSAQLAAGGSAHQHDCPHHVHP